jgi:dienelactone hydrolase
MTHLAFAVSAAAAVGISCFSVNSGLAEVQTKTITYQHGDVECHGYLAWDDAVQGKRPGILVLHEWWGLNEYARDRTEQLAGLGYVAFAADIYGEGTTVDHPQDAGKMATAVRANVGDWRQRATEALQVLKSQPQCDETKIGAIGYCFGGSTALQLAYTGAHLEAVVTFHAALPAPTPQEAQSIPAEILVCHGADDSFVSDQSVAAFRKRLDAADVKYTFTAYPGAGHSFTVPTADKHGVEGLKYNEAADKASWEAMQELFARKLK